MLYEHQTLGVQRTFPIQHDLLVEEVSLDDLGLELVDLAVEELAEVLEVEQLREEVGHVGAGLDEAAGSEGGRDAIWTRERMQMNLTDSSNHD